jgi:hypothetical protein
MNEIKELQVRTAAHTIVLATLVERLGLSPDTLKQIGASAKRNASNAIQDATPDQRELLLAMGEEIERIFNAAI